MVVRKIIFNLLMLSFINSLAQDKSTSEYPFRIENLIPWSIVTFDSEERTLTERIEMVKKLGFNQYAFGGREKHIETMEQEIRLAQKENIKISAVWLYMNLNKDKPGVLKPVSEKVFQALKNTGLETQIWVGFYPKYFAGLSQEQALQQVKEMIAYLSDRAEKMNCKVALYNHGGWPGDPKNLIEVINGLPQH